MKYWIPLLILALLLCGCEIEPPPTAPPQTTPSTQAPDTIVTDPTQTTVPAPTEPAIDENAALNEMALQDGYDAMVPLGSDLLLFRGNELSYWAFGAEAPTATVTIENLPLPGGKLRVLEEQIVYFDTNSHTLTYLNTQLKVAKRLQLDEQILGEPYLTQDGSKLYFCAATGLRFWDIETGICRNLMVQEGNWLGITGTLLEETGLRCQLQQSDGTVRTLLISTTGQTIWEGDALNEISGYGSLYCYPTEAEWIFGFADQQPQTLQIASAMPLPRLHGALNLTTQDTGLTLDLYDLRTGLRSASLELPGVSQISGITETDDLLFFLADGKLLRWNPKLSPTEDEKCYTAYRYTADAPDKEGLAALKTQANALAQRYGIEILLWEDAAAAEPAGYTFGIEYRTEIFKKGLTTLEAALSHFPETLPGRAASWAVGTMHIVLVESIRTPSETAYATLSGMQYLLDGKIYIVLALDEKLEQSFYHALFHVIEPLVLSNSIAYYKWNDLNPSGFRYDNDYIKNLDRDSSKHLEGTRYFIDTYSMSYVAEDRARIFEYAMMSGNEDYFTSKPMQSKLKMLCKGIREVFGLKGESYPWEQYLK